MLIAGTAGRRSLGPLRPTGTPRVSACVIALHITSPPACPPRVGGRRGTESALTRAYAPKARSRSAFRSSTDSSPTLKRMIHIFLPVAGSTTSNGMARLS